MYKNTSFLETVVVYTCFTGVIAKAPSFTFKSILCLCDKLSVLVSIERLHGMGLEEER